MVWKKDFLSDEGDPHNNKDNDHGKEDQPKRTTAKTTMTKKTNTTKTTHFWGDSKVSCREQPSHSKDSVAKLPIVENTVGQIHKTKPRSRSSKTIMLTTENRPL